MLFIKKYPFELHFSRKSPFILKKNTYERFFLGLLLMNKKGTFGDVFFIVYLKIKIWKKISRLILLV